MTLAPDASLPQLTYLDFTGNSLKDDSIDIDRRVALGRQQLHRCSQFDWSLLPAHVLDDVERKRDGRFCFTSQSEDAVANFNRQFVFFQFSDSEQYYYSRRQVISERNFARNYY
jgi:hypothetical protein